MRHNERFEQQRAWADCLAQTDWHVFGTLKFTDGHSMKTQIAQRLVRKFWNKLDRLYLGQNHVSAGHRIERIVSEQLGTSGENLHYHFVAKLDGDIARFCDTARWVWEETSNFTIGYEKTVIEPARNARSASGYCLHEYLTRGADTIFLEACHKRKDQAPKEPLPKLRRLLKRSDENEEIRERSFFRAAQRAPK